MGVRGRSLPREILALRDRVEEWRRTRSARGQMPAELWSEAVSVARRRGLYTTARGAGVDFGALAKRVRGEPPGAQSTSAITFVEWSGAQILGQVRSPGCAVVEMSDAAGRHVTVRLDSTGGLDVAGIVAAFCGSRP